MKKHLSNKPSTQENATQPPATFEEEKPTKKSNDDNHTYSQILKSSAIIGGSSIINIAIGIIRTKAMALMLGPSGVGLLGLYGTITDLTQNIVGMGINSSGVQQIAQAVGTGDNDQVAKTAAVLRRTAIFLGLLGAVFLFGLSPQLSVLTFGNNQHANGIALLSIAVFFNLISAGQGALIQGLRRINDLAKIGIFGALYGTLISIPTVYYLGEDGVVVSLVLIAAMALITSWWYRRKIHFKTPTLAVSDLGREQMTLLKLGFALMSSGLMMTGAAYAIRIFIVRDVGFEAAGLYQSAWALGGLYVGFILQAMGADFYPRLTTIANNNKECNRLVNEQAHVSMLLAGPGVIATLTFAPLVIALFYTSKFEGAVELLRWLCLGMTLRVISWPMGFIIVAKCVQNLLIFSELAWTIFYLGLAWVCIKSFGLNGAGIAFFGSYIFHIAMIYVIVRKLSRFRWSRANLETSIIYLALIAVVFSSYYVLPPLLAMGVGTLAIIASSIYSIKTLLSLVSADRIPSNIYKLMQWFNFTVSKQSENNGYKTTDGLRADIVDVEKKSLINIKWLITAIISCIFFLLIFVCYNHNSMWLSVFNAIESGFESLRSILQKN